MGDALCAKIRDALAEADEDALTLGQLADRLGVPRMHVANAADHINGVDHDADAETLALSDADGDEDDDDAGGTTTTSAVTEFTAWTGCGI